VNRARTARKVLGDGDDTRELAEALAEAESELVAGGGGKRSLFVDRAGLDTKLRQLSRMAAAAPPTPSALQVADDLDHRVTEVLEWLTALLEQAQQLEGQSATVD